MAVRFDIKSNASKIAEKLREKNTSLSSVLFTGMVTGMRSFERKMIKEQFTGRPGLRRVSGTAANSWHITKKYAGYNSSVILSNRPTAWYIVVHQHAKGFNGIIRPKTPNGKLRFKINNNWVTASQVKIPKRLFIPESFIKYGAGMMHDSMKRKLRSFIKDKK